MRFEATISAQSTKFFSGIEMKARLTGLLLSLLVSTSVYAAGPNGKALEMMPITPPVPEKAAFAGSPAQIPEPGALALIATGLAGIAVLRRRRRR